MGTAAVVGASKNTYNIQEGQGWCRPPRAPRSGRGHISTKAERAALRGIKWIIGMAYIRSRTAISERRRP